MKNNAYKKDDLGTRMKTFYEEIPKTKLMRRVPVAIRIDGRSFHTFTRKFQKPFDEVLIKSMQDTMKYLCENIQGCVMGYTQSDEITLILVDYKKLTSDAWFDYEVQKMCSVSASIATMAFNQCFKANVDDEIFIYKNSLTPQDLEFQLKKNMYHKSLLESVNKGAMFDSRCFNIPKEEVTNLLYWRQLDATRNSIQMVGRAYFSHNELYNKSCNDIQDMLILKKGINWNDIQTYKKRGTCCIKNTEKGWYIDKEIPIFKGEGREYIEKLINFEEESL